MLPNDVRDASRLIEWGLHARALPEAHPEYRELVRRWLDDGAFRTAVASIAEGLKLRVVGVTPRAGIVLGTETDSMFAYTISRFRRQVSSDDAAVIALVLVATCATFYPAKDVLDSDEVMSPTATLSEIRDRLTKLCQALESQDRLGDATAARWRKGWQSIVPFRKSSRRRADPPGPISTALWEWCSAIFRNVGSLPLMSVRTAITSTSPRRAFA